MTNKEKQLALKSAERNVEHSINTCTIAGTIIYKSTLKDQVKTNREGKYILYVKVRTDFSDKKFHDIPLRLLDRQAIMVYDNFEVGDYIAIQGSIKYFSETGKLFVQVEKLAFPLSLHIKELYDKFEVREDTTDIYETVERKDTKTYVKE